MHYYDSSGNLINYNLDMNDYDYCGKSGMVFRLEDDCCLKTYFSYSTENVKMDFDIFTILKKMNHPNVYKLKEGSRVIDVINMAGGLKENADTSIINLSKKITDEMCIIIYTKEDIQKYKNQMLSTNEIKEKLEQENVSIDNFNDAEINKSNKESNTKENKISINTASIEELMTISGIGESKAKAIISYREENGPFEDIEDIMNVSGIGESLYAKIKDKIEL